MLLVSTPRPLARQLPRPPWSDSKPLAGRAESSSSRGSRDMPPTPAVLQDPVRLFVF